MRLIMGGVHSGKTAYCLSEAAQRIRNNHPVQLISNSRRALARNRRWLLEKHDIEVLSHRNFCLLDDWLALIAQIDMPRTYASRFMQIEWLKKCLAHIPEESVWFKNINSRESLLRLLRFFDEMDGYGDFVSNVETDKEFLDEIQKLYLSFHNFLQQAGYTTRSHFLKLVLEKICTANHLSNQNGLLILDGMDDLNLLEVKIFQKIFQIFHDCWFTLNMDISQQQHYPLGQWMLEQFRPGIHEMIELPVQPVQINKFSCQYTDHYFQALQKLIGKIWHLRSEGVPFKKIAIVVTPMIHIRSFLLELSRAQIPFYGEISHALFDVAWIHVLIKKWSQLYQAEKYSLKEWNSVIQNYLRSQMDSIIQSFKIQDGYQIILHEISCLEDCIERLYVEFECLNQNAFECLVSQYVSLLEERLRYCFLPACWSSEESVHLIEIQELSFGDYDYVFYFGWDAQACLIQSKHSLVSPYEKSKIWPEYLRYTFLDRARTQFYKNISENASGHIYFFNWQDTVEQSNCIIQDYYLPWYPLSKAFSVTNREKSFFYQENRMINMARNSEEYTIFDGNLHEIKDIIQSDCSSKKIRFSPSLLGAFSTCYFKGFAEYVLRVFPEKQAVMALDHKEQGSLVHHVLEYMYQDIAKLKNMSLEQIQEHVQSYIQSCYTNLSLAECVRYTRIIVAFIIADRERWVKEESTYPRYLEYKFTNLDLFNDANILISGQIDRIDLSQSGDGIIYDYKSNVPTQDEVLNGLAVQIPIYILAVEQLQLARRVIGAAYYRYKNPQLKDSRNIGLWLKDAVRQNHLDVSAKKSILEEDQWHSTLRNIKGLLKRKAETMLNGKYFVLSVSDQYCNKCESRMICHRNVKKMSIHRIKESAAC